MSEKSKKSIEQKQQSLKKAINTLKASVSFYKGMGYIKTGILSFDSALGGGLPSGRIIEISSREGIGKTTLGLYVCKAIIEQGYKTVFIDTEHAVTPTIIEGIGLDPYLNKGFYLVKESTWRAISNLFDNILKTTDCALIVLDSLAGAKPAKLLTMNVEDVEPGLQARIQATFFQKYKELLAMQNISLMVLNQMRTKISFTGPSFDIPFGGNAVKFFVDARLKLVRKTILSEKGEDGVKKDYGSEVEILTLKNKISGNNPPIPMTILFGKGISNIAFIYELLLDKQIITRSGSYYYIENNKLHGRQALVDHIKNNYDYLCKLAFKQISKENIKKTSDRQVADAFKSGGVDKGEDEPLIEPELITKKKKPKKAKNNF